MPRLKVFCTTSGFHDSIVAAPSKPAALKAWGAKTDLFSMGAAKLVTDPKIAKKALDRPGEVIRLKRSGGGAEVVAPKKRAKPKKPPSRAKLAAAEKRFKEIEGEQAGELDAIDSELKALEKKRAQLVARHAKTRKAAAQKRKEAQDEYEAALAEWDG